MLSYEASKVIAHWFLFSLMFFADVCDLLERIILKDVLRKATNLYQLVQIDPSVKNMRKSAADIDTGFSTNIKVEEFNLNPNDPKVLPF